MYQLEIIISHLYIKSVDIINNCKNIKFSIQDFII